jgi:SAM-dependent methyltransferase
MALDVLTWKDGERLRVGGTVFHALAPGDEFALRGTPEAGEFVIFKSRPLIETYAALIAERRPERILELGFWGGGSTVLLAELARPAKLVAIDLQPLNEVRARVAAHAEMRGFGEVIRTFGEVDQADRPRIAQIVEDEFEGYAPDLIVDDCSHLYEPTRASFNELFPRLRPQGAYLIEDWTWAHTPLDSDHPEGFLPDEVPLTRLFFEIQLAIPSVPGLIESISIDRQAAVITRGDAEINPKDFEIASCANQRGLSLLAPP